MIDSTSLKAVCLDAFDDYIAKNVFSAGRSAPASGEGLDPLPPAGSRRSVGTGSSQGNMLPMHITVIYNQGYFGGSHGWV